MFKLRKKSSTNKSSEGIDQPVTNDTLDDHRQQIFKRARKLVKPLGLSRKKFLTLTASIIAGGLLLFLIVFGILIYGLKSEGNMVYRVAQVIPYPVSRVNGHFVSYGDYLFELNPLKHYYQQKPAGQNAANQQPTNFSTPEGQQQLAKLRVLALDEAKQIAIVSQLAAENHVSLAQSELDSAVNDAISREGGNDKFAEAIKYFYGWNINDFRQVLRQQLLQRKLQPVFSGEQRARAEAILKRLQNGESFSKLAQKFSEDPGSKKKGGDLGFLAHGVYVKQFEDVAFTLNPGQTSQIVETQFGFHIIKAISKKGDQIRVAHILIQYADINKIIKDKLDQASVKNYVSLKSPTQPSSPSTPQQ